ncbi:glycosyltransferase family 4 protein [Thiomicrorhabdus sp. ZW0627]|uniref:glycosyltransferase family 4 protein n=1 Tax=Thiomicrorhabdus sp. ZW0627 TaxID=3039774 RepID=UPI002436EF8B|nr:glycosyltransferase family 4 protein [Thiomicrorhabdus sp. ZW0627]MDG6773617.1 glycosyltransferase family 4 protein [Thiomicrorhabdus sp. ZW0627]
MKVAIIHDWLVTYAGAERVLEQMIKVYPEADLFSMVDFIPEEERGFISHKAVQTSFIQNLPWAKSKYRSYLPLMPLAVEQFDLSSYDLVISSSHAVAKAVITGPDQLHISYIHSPIRYAWDLQHQYLRESGLNKGLKGWVAKYLLHRIRKWDVGTSNRVDVYIANSNFIKRRIEKVYRRDSVVIYPPVSVKDFSFCDKKEDYYLTASRMVPYKKMDMIVEAFTKMPNKKLRVIGTGPDFAKIQKIAKNFENIQLMGYQSFPVLKDSMEKAKAFVFAAEEDFGITPVEAQACGTPVIAFAKGGVLETVQGLDEANPTGVFFKEQTSSSLSEAIDVFEENAHKILYENCEVNASRFSNKRFREEFKEFVEKEYKNWKERV